MGIRLYLAFVSLLVGCISFCDGDPARSVEARFWALQPIQHPVATTLQSTHWARSSIDTFVLARQREKGLSPSPDADRRSLVRRVSLDLIGLPPRPDQVEAFVTDERPDAYCRLVDRLLSSPRFGERMTQHWLDVARYADSDGYHDDTNRAMWPYRDWVIRSFNMNKPFDEFLY